MHFLEVCKRLNNARRILGKKLKKFYLTGLIATLPNITNREYLTQWSNASSKYV